MSLNIEIFVIHILILKVEARILINFSTKISIPTKYSNYNNIFLPKFVAKFLKNSNNNYGIKLKDSKQPLYSLIHSLKQIELKILKIYIKINLANKLIGPFKFLIGTLILFN